jgi:hypothetical protein
MHACSSVRGNFTVKIKLGPNLDYRSGPQRTLVGTATKKVKSLEEAATFVRRYLTAMDAGGGNLRSAIVYKKGDKRPVADISFNGRVWAWSGFRPDVIAHPELCRRKGS